MAKSIIFFRFWTVKCKKVYLVYVCCFKYVYLNVAPLVGTFYALVRASKTSYALSILVSTPHGICKKNVDCYWNILCLVAWELWENLTVKFFSGMKSFRHFDFQILGFGLYRRLRYRRLCFCTFFQDNVTVLRSWLNHFVAVLWYQESLKTTTCPKT